MLARKLRICKKSDFGKIFKSGSRSSSSLIKIFWLKNDSLKCRFAFIVANSVSKKSTVRNKIKRRLRAIIYKHIKEFVPEFDYIIMAQKPSVEADYQSVEMTIVDQLKKYKLLNG